MEVFENLSDVLYYLTFLSLFNNQVQLTGIPRIRRLQPIRVLLVREDRLLIFAPTLKQIIPISSQTQTKQLGLLFIMNDISTMFNKIFGFDRKPTKL